MSANSLAFQTVLRSHLLTRSKAFWSELLAESLVVLAVCTLSLGIVLSVNQVQSNKLVIQQVTKLVAHARQQPNTLVPSTTPPPVVDEYKVAPSRPRYLTIPRLDIHARVQSVGTTAAGAVGAPSNVFDTAWYNASAKPGAPGAVFIDGHVSSWTTRGIFYELGKLRSGDRLEIERGDGTLFRYHVVRTQVYESDKVDMVAALRPVVAGRSGLNLMTCAGSVINGTNEFDHRVIVFATQD